jgi:hypothetical protein
VFVRGSHDSPALQGTIAAQSNAVVLDGRSETIEGLTLYGLGHPEFTPARGVPVDDEAFAEAARSSGAVIGSALDGADDRFDVIAVHDDRMAEAVAGRVPLVISGHFHETTATVRNGTLFLRIGTTGGSGAGIFRDLGVPFSAEVLYFSRETQPELVAYDVIEQFPESGSLTVQRVNVVQEFGLLSPTPSPSRTTSESETPSPGIASSGSPSSAS